jgi:hypothetical protein
MSGAVLGGKEASIASCTLTGRNILPVFLMRPVGCAACFPRDYRLIFTWVRKRSHRHDSSAEPHQSEHCLKMASVTLVPGDLLADRTRPEFS